MHENEILIFILGSIILGFMYRHHRVIKQLAYYKLLIAAFLSIYCAWLATNLEHLLLPALFNYLEHLSYAVNGALLLAWCYLNVRNKQRDEHN